MNTSDNEKTSSQPIQKDKSFLNGLIIGVIGFASGLYLCFPGSVFVRAAVEVIPVVGMFDEAAAAAILFSCLSYFGLDLTNIFGKAKIYDDRTAKAEKRTEKPINATVVDS